MKKKTKKQKEKEQLLTTKNESAPLLKEVIEFEDEETKLIQDIPTKNIKKK
jgi:hypothetical protein